MDSGQAARLRRCSRTGPRPGPDPDSGGSGRLRGAPPCLAAEAAARSPNGSELRRWLQARGRAPARMVLREARRLPLQRPSEPGPQPTSLAGRGNSALEAPPPPRGHKVRPRALGARHRRSPLGSAARGLCE